MSLFMISKKNYLLHYWKKQMIRLLLLENRKNFIDTYIRMWFSWYYSGNKSNSEKFTPKYLLEDREKLYRNFKDKNVVFPYCYSKDTEKISNVFKTGEVALFGIFAISKVNKRWHWNH